MPAEIPASLSSAPRRCLRYCGTHLRRFHRSTRSAMRDATWRSRPAPPQARSWRARLGPSSRRMPWRKRFVEHRERRSAPCRRWIRLRDTSARRVFQAWRITVTNQFDVMNSRVHELPFRLRAGGRVVAVTFNFDESRRVRMPSKATCARVITRASSTKSLDVVEAKRTRMPRPPRLNRAGLSEAAPANL